MTPTMEWQRAAFRVLTKCQVRTHIRAAPPPPDPEVSPPAGSPIVLERRERIRQMLAEKVSQRDMATRLGISRTAVFNHIKVIRVERRKKATRRKAVIAA